MKVYIFGSNGFIGSSLAREYLNQVMMCCVTKQK